MANRLNAPNQFETLSPPWILSQLDTNFTQNQAAWNDSSLGFINGICTDTGVANAYVITAGNLPFGVPSAYNPGMTVFFIPANTNTGASTMTVGALGSAAILNKAGNALQGGELAANKVVGLIYNNSAPVGFRIVTTCSLYYTATAPGNVTLDCAGYDSVSANVTYNSATSTSLTLAHLASGVSVDVQFLNAFSSPVAYVITASDPAGTTFAEVGACFSSGVGGGSFVSLQSSQNVTNGFRVIYSGVSGVGVLRFSA